MGESRDSREGLELVIQNSKVKIQNVVMGEVFHRNRRV
jgi:hypothetical protein